MWDEYWKWGRICMWTNLHGDEFVWDEFVVDELFGDESSGSQFQTLRQSLARYIVVLQPLIKSKEICIRSLKFGVSPHYITPV